MRRITGLLGILVPKISASALWYWQFRCLENQICSGTRIAGQYQRRYCHDGSGYCYPWENYGCC